MISANNFHATIYLCHVRQNADSPIEWRAGRNSRIFSGSNLDGQLTDQNITKQQQKSLTLRGARCCVVERKKKKFIFGMDTLFR
jgi:hypothetical protein